MRKLCTAAVCVVIALAFGYAPCWAGEVVFPVPGYEGDELAAVRDWEKTWAGKKINAGNVDQVKEFLHEGVYNAIREPQIMGADSIWFEIVPYRAYNLSRGMIEATIKNSPAARLEENGMLNGYGAVAGIPFPRPKTGAEMAWNFDGNTRGDSHHEVQFGTVVDCKTRFERDTEQHRWELFWFGRYDVPPTPRFSEKENPRGIARSFFQRHAAPADFVDTTMLEIKYQDPRREEDLWVYTAMFRRIRRYANNQRTDSIDGTDMIYDDQDGWYTHLVHNTYASKGRAELLVARHQDQKNISRITGQGFWNGVQRERVNTWVVEVKNKDPNYIYGRQVWYLDPENWQMNFKVMYNRKGELWKMYEMFYNELPSYGGQTTPIFNSEHVIDFLRNHGSASRRDIKGIGIEIPLNQFRTQSLKKKSY